MADTERNGAGYPPAPAGSRAEGFPGRRTMAGIGMSKWTRSHDDPMGEVDYDAGAAKGTNLAIRTAGSRPWT